MKRFKPTLDHVLMVMFIILMSFVGYSSAFGDEQTVTITAAPENFQWYTVQTPAGGEVECLRHTGALDCNWGAK